jgi:predicted kinase
VTGTAGGRRLLLVQMAGAPGAGKTTLGRAVADRIGGVVINSDVVKTSLLDADVPWSLAGPAAYRALVALADDLLDQSRSVVLDSPSHYPQIPENGLRVAARHGAAYRFIECCCADSDELRRRLAARTPMRSQMRDLDLPPPDSGGTFTAVRVGEHRWQTFGPPEGHLTVDTGGALEPAVEEALRYLDSAATATGRPG